MTLVCLCWAPRSRAQ